MQKELIFKFAIDNADFGIVHHELSGIKALDAMILASYSKVFKSVNVVINKVYVNMFLVGMDQNINGQKYFGVLDVSDCINNMDSFKFLKQDIIDRALELLNEGE